ncbi:MAG: 50S ribosomal protein L4 [Bdellovibrionales bacterium]|nr:50S ribosomal protein L4 [Bdellovibrionales bacterium]
MATVEVLNWSKKKVGEVDLSPVVFEAPVRKDILDEIVKWQLASRRSGTHKAKTRAEVSGGGKKPFKQKGTGNARQGSSRSPLMEGGGITFGPNPRDYSYTLPKKVKQMGLRSALSLLLKEGKLAIVEDMGSENGKTNELAKRLKSFGVEKVVLITGEKDDLFSRAARNLPKVRYYGTEGMNVFDLLKYDYAIITKDSVDKIVARCGVGK